MNYVAYSLTFGPRSTSLDKYLSPPRFPTYRPSSFQNRFSTVHVYLGTVWTIGKIRVDEQARWFGDQYVIAAFRPSPRVCKSLYSDILAKILHPNDYEDFGGALITIYFYLVVNLLYPSIITLYIINTIVIIILLKE